jgi:hypothetical protein
MAFTLRRPILIGGLGLTLAGLAWNSLGFGMADLGGTVVWGAIALGGGYWLLTRSQQALPIPTQVCVPVDPARVKNSLEMVQTLIGNLEAEQTRASGQPYEATSLRYNLATLKQDLERTQVTLAVTGGKSVGKTTLSRLLPMMLGHGNSPNPELPQSCQDAATVPAASEPNQSDPSLADLVLFVTAGDLTASEFQSLQTLVETGQRVLLVFNKQDQYLPGDRTIILYQLKERVREFIPAEDVVAIATNPAPIKVRRHQSEGSWSESLQQPAPDLVALQERLRTILKGEGRQLILNSVHRQSLQLKANVLADLNRLRRARALPLIEQAQWLAAGTAFANPVPSLDLLTTAAINGQLVMDLGNIYQQPLTLDQGKMIATTLAGQMVQLGLVELTSQAVSGLLKSHALTYVAGGLIQGISAAYLTRLAGLTLVEYFQTQSQVDRSAEQPLSVERLAELVKSVFQSNQRTDFLRSLVSQGVNRLTPQMSS